MFSTNPTNTANSPADPLSVQWFDLRLVSILRLMLAPPALVVTLIEPSEPGRWVSITYATLALYTIYSAVVFSLSIRRTDLIPAKYMHWVDMVWYLGLIALTGGANSIFFNFFFFAILVASFGWGYKAGLRLTLFSAVLFTVVAVKTAPLAPAFESNHLMFR